MTISRIEQDREKIEQQRMFSEQNAWSNEQEINEIVDESIHQYDKGRHPMDIRSDPGMRDPALVDLQPYKDAVHADRMQRERRQAERKREYLRTKYEGQGEIKTFIKTRAY